MLYFHTRFLNFAVAGILGMGLTAGPTRALGQEPTVQAPPANGSSNQPSIESSDYLIGPGDVLQITVWQEPQFTEKVEVRPDGKISMPLVGDVAVSDLTPKSATERLTSKLEGFVKHPRLTVVVAEVHSRIVYVIGQVLHPGPYPLVEPINVEQLIARAGGTTERAKKKKVYVLRQGSNTKIPVNYEKVLEGKRKALEQNIELSPGDTVVVP